MSGRLFRGCLAGALAVGMFAGLAFADDRMSSNTGLTEDKVARLEALLESQQQQIKLLEEQVAAGNAQDQEKQRVEAMKEQIRAVLKEDAFRETLVPPGVQAGYDKGFFIQSSDNKFRLKINGVLQFRWTHYATRSDNRWLRPRQQRNDRTGFEMPRIWLVFSGHAYAEELTYKFVVDTGSQTGYSFRPFYAYVNYKFQDEFQFRAGLMRIQSTRMQVLPFTGNAMVDRNMVDAVFGLGLGIGAQFWGKCADGQFEWALQVLNGTNSGRGNAIITADTGGPTGTNMDSNPALVFRAVFHALGEGDGSDFKTHGDMEFHDSPALDFGFHYAYNEDEGDSTTTRIPYNAPRRFARGGFGLTNTNGVAFHQFGLDAHMKWQGFSLIGEYMLRILDVRRGNRTPFSNLWLLTGDGSTTVMHGAYVQAGYFLPVPGMEKQLEAVFRIGGISTNAGGSEGTWEYAGGLNYYFLEGNHKVKLQTDVTKITEVPITSNYSSLANVNDDALVWRIQLQVAF